MLHIKTKTLNLNDVCILTTIRELFVYVPNIEASFNFDHVIIFINDIVHA